MSDQNLFHGPGSYLALNLDPRDESHGEHGRHAPALTVAKQTGSRGVAICTKLHKKLQAKDAKDSLPWTLFDSELTKQILKEHNLPEYLEKFIPEDKVGEVESTINEILGRHPSLWTLFKDTKQTINGLARSGHCIIVGRGGNHIAGFLHNVLNVRIIGSFEARLKYTTENMQLTEDTARSLLKREDHARHDFIKQHFHCDIDDPKYYDLVINTDHMTDEQVVDILTAGLDQLKS